MQEKMQEKMGIITLISGYKGDDQPCYAYVLVPPDKYMAFKQAESGGNYNVADYGTILKYGEGLEPTEDVQKQMEKEYGVNHRLEEQLEALIGAIDDKE